MDMETGGGGANGGNGVPSGATAHIWMMYQRLLATRSLASMFAQGRNARPADVTAPRGPAKRGEK